MGHMVILEQKFLTITVINGLERMSLIFRISYADMSPMGER